MTLFKAFSFALALTTSASSFAKVIQIIHTNDLHSYFQGTRGGLGGYAQLKTVIDKLKADAAAEDVPSLYLDGGDFGEGSSFYFSNHGVDSLRALDLLGVDVTVLGNHDFILGGKQLRNQMNAAGLKTKMLSANLIGKRLMGLHHKLPDYADFKFDDISLRVFGLTTNEIHYMYPLRPLGFIAHPHNAGIKQAQAARRANIDVTLALTHIGLSNDIKLVQKTHSIDLVVGGHSHTRLPKPQMTKNLNGRMIPIFQAGAHAGFVGSLIIDLQPNGESKIIDYQLIDITKEMDQEPRMASFVESAYQMREKYFGRSWDEVIGSSEIELSGNVNGLQMETRTCWSRHIARLSRTVAKTELGLQFDVFQGENIPAGPVTYGDLIDNFPHFRAWGDKGWKISRARVSGFLLKSILNLLANSEVALQVMIDGLKVQNKNGQIIPYDQTIHKVYEAMISGEGLQNMRFYTIALPSEVPFGIKKLAGPLTYLFLNHLRTVPGSDYWPLMENYIKENSPLRCLED